jgi:hypothetical protein
MHASLSQEPNLNLGNYFHECLGYSGYNTHTHIHTHQYYLNRNIRFTSEAYLSGTRTVVTKFMGFVCITAAGDLIKKLFIPTIIITHEPKECTQGLLRLV